MIKKTIRSLLSRFGYNLVRKNDVNFADPFDMQKRLLSGTKNPVIFDVGAHQGQSIKKYLRIFPDSIIHSFEPYTKNYELVENIYKDAPNVKVYNLALGHREAKVPFFVNSQTATNSLFAVSDNVDRYWDKKILANKEIVEIEQITLDSFRKGQNISTIEILKLDTQGSEYLVLEGAEESLREKAIKMIYIELITKPTYDGQLELDAVLKRLRDYDYELYSFYNLSYTSGGMLRQMDAIFIPK